MATTISGTTITMNSGAVLGPIDGNAPGYFCRAWVFFDGTGTIGAAQSIYGSESVSSVVKNGTGDYTVNLSVSLDGNTYAVHGGGGTGSGLSRIVEPSVDDAPTDSSVNIVVYDSAGARQSIAYVAVAIIQ